MYPASPPATDLSRSRLKALAKWVRDDLDILVAREGPNVLRPDDVLILHETFISLRQATDITALDLRATGIHRAVQDIAGVATRWPGRLCDDCDQIVALWTAKFGPFNQLHPFLYGRGGRLEGIASANEYSREALLKRWSETCPGKLHPKRSHRHGDLGFQAGDWWINSLFAHHAGIIGIEAVEGGTTFDKHGAYALLLKDTGEIEASGESKFTYRVPMADKGKYRLTAATPRSRDPIRVLRSHSINSVWGPKAGVRYEGLFGVRGWSVHQAKTADRIGGEWKKGDIIFEVKFERHDPVPMDEVIKRPTATEVDDYAEYKRLRKVYRESKRKVPGSVASPFPTDLALHRAAPPIQPPQPSGLASGAPKVRQGSPSRGSSRKPMFHRPHFDLPDVHLHAQPDVVSPMTMPDTDLFPLLRSTLAVPSNAKMHPRSPGANDSSSSGQHQANRESSGTSSNVNSANTAASMQANIREVAPWIDFDAGLTLHPPGSELQIIREKIVSQAGDPRSKAPISYIASNNAMDSPPIHSHRDRRQSGDFKGLTGLGNLNPASSSKNEEGRKSIFVRRRNPATQLFDGAPSEEGNDYFGNAVFKEEDANAQDTPPQRPREAPSSNAAVRVHSPIPTKPIDPDTPLKTARRGAVFPAPGEEDPDAEKTQAFSPTTSPLRQNTCTSTKRNSSKSTHLPRLDPFVDSTIATPTLAARLAAALPTSLKNLVARHHPAPVTATAASPSPHKASVAASGDAMASERVIESLEMDRANVDSDSAAGVTVEFTNPFAEKGSGSPQRRSRKIERQSSGVAPDVVLEW